MAQWERRDKARQELQSIFEKRDEEKKWQSPPTKRVKLYQTLELRSSLRNLSYNNQNKP
jgi:hypothetical protein